jgi:hypothetical protein
LFVAAATSFRAAEPVRYRFSFPEPQHRWMQVDATFFGVTQTTLELRMSRSSPGRYSLHDFAKNVYDVHAFGADGRELALRRPDPYGWNVTDHGGTVTVKYKVYGDRVDGTYLAVDATHAHINMPAVVMWARGFDDQPATVTFERPAGAGWQVATQLHGEGLEFTAPNLQYLMDSPAEFGPIAMRQFSVGSSRFRFALHHTGTDAELDSLVKDVERIVRQEGAIYGEYPDYEPGHYTFLADYLPYASGDGMEHRNSTIVTAQASIRGNRASLLGTVAHEFFHSWNVERIRPKSLEPFNFDDANMSGELWLAEGFTNYYGPLSLAVPDKRYCFDRFRPLTGIGRVIDASHNPQKIYSAGTVAEYFLTVVSKGGHIAWDADEKGEFKLVHSLEQAKQAIRDVGERGTYLDVHEWCFTPTSFRLMMRDLFELGFIQLKELAFHPSQGSEFYIALSRAGVDESGGEARSYLVDVPGSWKRSLVPAGLAVENRGGIVATVPDVVLNCECAATL